jgi:hypothetical protein
MKTSTIAVATAAFAMATLAAAQTTSPAVEPGSTKAAPPTFAAMDANKDGKVSRAEARAHGELNSNFGTLDGDRDDNLSESEYDKWHSKPGGMQQTNPSGTRPGTGTQSTPAGSPTQGTQSAPGQGGQAPSGTR